MANIFKDTAVHYFQLPNEVIESRGLWHKLAPTSRCVYVYLCFLAQKNSSAHNRVGLKLTDQNLADGAGISVKSVPAARKQLWKKSKLVDVRTEGKAHFYRILDPVTGAALEKVEDFDKLPSDLIDHYFQVHLKDYGVDYKDEGKTSLRARCPFHETFKTRQRDLHISLSDGGVWRCVNGKCEESGKLVRFEQLMARKKGEIATDGGLISTTVANHRVRELFKTVVRERHEKARIERLHRIDLI